MSDPDHDGDYPETVLREIFAECLALEESGEFVAAESQRGCTPGWDSAGHMDLVSRIESRFGITLETTDIIEMDTFARAQQILRKHLAGSTT